jgi:hypothetical protein
MASRYSSEVVRRACVLIACAGLLSLVMLPAGRLVYAGGEAELAKPRWKTGDAWTVKCSEMSYEPSRGPYKIGEYSVVVTVLAPAKSLRGTECYVLEIHPGGDLPEHMRKYSDYVAEHVFYATDTLELTQIERWRTDTKGKKTFGRETSTDRHHLPSVYYGENGYMIPLLLPQFPLTRGKGAQYRRHDYRVTSTLREAKEGRDVALSGVGDAVVEEPAREDALAAGASKVTFYFTTTYSKSGAIRKKVAEQVWVPGKPWWSVARLYQGPNVTDFRLAE